MDEGEAAQESTKSPGLRFLEAAVYIMGGLLVLMVVGVIGGIAWKLTHRAAPEATERALDIPVPAGATVSGVTLDGDRLAVQIDGGGKTEIVVVDARKGTVLSRIRLAPGAAAGR